jgi:hypothetical protein
MFGGDKNGMTLRQWYAGMALQGLIQKFPSVTNADIARHAFGYADAMLAHEQKNGEKA